MGLRAVGDVTASVILLTYNQEVFVEAALRSFLEQDLTDLEIVVSDDASTDGTWMKIKQVAESYRGPKTIKLHQNPRNLGIAENYNRAFALTTGDVVFSAAGDDISAPTRCAECIAAWIQHDCIPDLVATDALDMTFEGEVLGPKPIDDLQAWTVGKWFAQRPYHLGASHMLTRRLIEVNAIDPQLNAEDQVFMFRAILMGGALRLQQPLVSHRRGGVSSKKKRLGYDDQRKRLLDSAQASAIESDQMRLDWIKIRSCDSLPGALTAALATAEFTMKMLGSDRALERLHLLGAYLTVPWRKRLRFFLFASLSWLYRPFLAVRALRG